MDNTIFPILLPFNSFTGHLEYNFIRHFDTIPHYADVRVGVGSVGVSQRNVGRWREM